MDAFCPNFGADGMLSPEYWRCDCDGPWGPVKAPECDPGLTDSTDSSVCRHRFLYGLDFSQPRGRLGAGGTPLLSLVLGEREVLLKVEYLGPAASLKHRGVEVMMNVLTSQGVTAVVNDSSGNARVAGCLCCAVRDASEGICAGAHSLCQAEADCSVRSTVESVPGPGANAKVAAFEVMRGGAVPVSRAHHPGFLLGQQSLPWELWEKLGCQPPDWYVVSVGQGLHFADALLGFQRLSTAGPIDRVPKLAAAQAKALKPSCWAFEDVLDRVPGVKPTTLSVAEGIAIDQPVTGRRLLQAIPETGATCIFST